MVYGYCRVSTLKQNIERQKNNIIAKYPEAIIYEEKLTGTKFSVRKQFKEMLFKVKPGDTIVFDSVSRMSRNAEEGIKLFRGLNEYGVNIVFLKDQYINTNMHPSDEQIRYAFMLSEKEIEYFRIATKEGIKVAQSHGKRSGHASGTKLVTKKSIKAKEIILKHNKTFGGSLNDEETMKKAGVSHVTFYKYKKELVENGGYYE